MTIPEAFKDQEIFVTGASGWYISDTKTQNKFRKILKFNVFKLFYLYFRLGFVGKALIEKLLRSCPKLGRIYVLMRPKKGLSIEERLQLQWESKLYERLRREQPDGRSKLVAIAGDVEQLGLGISKADLERLRNVNIVYHSAASVRYV